MTKIYKTKAEFNERENKLENGVSTEFVEGNPKWEQAKESNEGCWNCSRCSGCSDCSGCSGCYRCSDCSDCYGKYGSEAELKILTVPNIHQKVLEAVSSPGAFEMGNWHKCEMTHCRGGWVINLERKTSSEFAAMMIYKASSSIKVSPRRFYESNEVAMADIVRCAKEEAELTKKP